MKYEPSQAQIDAVAAHFDAQEGGTQPGGRHYAMAEALLASEAVQGIFAELHASPPRGMTALKQRSVIVDLFHMKSPGPISKPVMDQALRDGKMYYAERETLVSPWVLDEEHKKDMDAFKVRQDLQYG